MNNCIGIINLDENEEKIEIDYITGSLSYDRIRKGNEDSKKSLPIQVDNNGTESKNFNVTVRYLGEDELAQNNISVKNMKEKKQDIIGIDNIIENFEKIK